MKTKPKIYFIPGLGADGRLFEALREKGMDFEVLEFIHPEKKESLRDYARRLAEPIDEGNPFIIGGVSLGGIMSMEIAKVKRPEKVIAISTVKNSREFPFYFRMMRYFPVYRALSGKFLIKYAPKEKRSTMRPDFAEILKEMRKDADPVFVKWAVHALLHWRSKEIPENVVHIHGTNDLMFPGWLLGDRHRVKGGSHVMIMTHAEEILQKLEEEISMI